MALGAQLFLTGSRLFVRTKQGCWWFALIVQIYLSIVPDVMMSARPSEASNNRYGQTGRPSAAGGFKTPPPALFL